MRPLPDVLCQQLGRHWATNTAIAGGLTFCEPDDSTPSNLYACPLPVAAHRLNPAASITLTPNAASAPNVHLQTIDLAIEARAITDSGALAMLVDLHQLLWPTDGVFIHHATHYGKPVHGIPGIPALGAGSVWLWRVVTLTPVTGPVVVPGGGTSPVRAASGEAVATMTLSAACAPSEIDWWVEE